MKKKAARLLIGVFILLLIGLSEQLFTHKSPPVSKVPEVVLGDKSSPAKVVRVIDGDTIEVLQSSQSAKIRVIGINTPETVDPRREVECFGAQASSHAKELLLGKDVLLENDPTQAEKDRYGRLLRYIFVEGSDYGLKMIQEGYAYEYTYDSVYKFQDQYKKAQVLAESNRVGLWGEGGCY